MVRNPNFTAHRTRFRTESTQRQVGIETGATKYGYSHGKFPDSVNRVKCFSRNGLCVRSQQTYLRGTALAFLRVGRKHLKGEYLMAHVVAQPCRDCRYTDCVVVCPANCFHEGRRMLYIHPQECIDCESCVPACPANAIFHEDRLPLEWAPFRDLNATMARQSPSILEPRNLMKLL